MKEIVLEAMPLGIYHALMTASPTSLLDNDKKKETSKTNADTDTDRQKKSLTIIKEETSNNNNMPRTTSDIRCVTCQKRMVGPGYRIPTCKTLTNYVYHDTFNACSMMCLDNYMHRIQARELFYTYYYDLTGTTYRVVHL